MTLQAHLQVGDDLDGLPESARQLVTDKEALTNALQSAQETHTSKLDALEDTLVHTEMKRAVDLVAKHTDWAYTRNRNRIIEIVTYHERNAMELETLLGVNEEDEEEA